MTEPKARLAVPTALLERYIEEGWQLDPDPLPIAEDFTRLVLL